MIYLTPADRYRVKSVALAYTIQMCITKSDRILCSAVCRFLFGLRHPFHAAARTWPTPTHTEKFGMSLKESCSER